MDADRARRRLIALSLTVVTAALAACGSSPHPTAKHTTTTTKSATPTPPQPASFSDKYATIKAGMTLDAVRGIMGSDGSTTSESEGAGITSIVIQWQDPKSSHSIIVSFVNNIVQTKTASGF